MGRFRRPGFLIVPRELNELPLWEGDFALKAVFFDLCFAAHFAPGEVTFNGRGHRLERGELVTSSRLLAARSGLSRKVIRRCLDGLQREGMISFRQKNAEGPADAEKGPAKGPAETVYIINDYDGLFGDNRGDGPSKGPSGERKGAQRAKSLPLYAGKNKNKNTYTNAGEAVCESPLGEGEPTGPASSTLESSFLEHPLIIEWNAACIGSKLQKVTQCTPSRLRAVAVAMRSKDDLSWWRVVFRQARLPISINGRAWVPRFNQVLDADRAAEYFETAQSKSHIRSVPSNQNQKKETKVELDSSGNGALGPLPEGGAKPRQVIEPGRLLRAFLGAEESRNIRKADGVDSE